MKIKFKKCLRLKAITFDELSPQDLFLWADRPGGPFLKMSGFKFVNLGSGFNHEHKSNSVVTPLDGKLTVWEK